MRDLRREPHHDGPDVSATTSSRRHRTARTIAVALATAAVAYLLVAYLAEPRRWLEGEAAALAIAVAAYLRAEAAQSRSMREVSR
jgi:hypothetical protein